MGFRDYSPGLNRFLTRDMYNGALADIRLGTDPWNTNRYAFAGGNPITGIELDGHYAILENGDRESLETPTITPPGTTGSTSPPPVTDTKPTESTGAKISRWFGEKPLGERATDELVVKPVTETYEACKAAIQMEDYATNWQQCKTGAALLGLSATGGGKIFGIGVRSLQGMAAARAEAAGASILTGRAAGSAAKGGAELISVAANDAAAKALAARLGGRASVRFADDAIGREFDAVSALYVAQTKPAGFTLGSQFRNQAKATFEAALNTGRTPYFHFEGPPGPGVISKLQEYGNRYGVHPVIDTVPLGG
jgi:hypothetical protein